jgi:glycosyltransferase involved in cell wall biosynthesis
VPEPRLLFLSPEYPDPDGNGGQVRLFHISRGLARLGAGVTIVAPGSADSIERGEALRELGVDLRPVRRPASRAREALGAISSDPRVATRALTRSWLAWQTEVYLTEMRETLAAAFGERWDGVVIEHDWALGWVSRVPAQLPVGLVFHNLTDRLLAQQAETESGLIGWRSRRDARLARRETDRLAPRLSAAFACSDPDADEVGRRWGLNCAVVPNGAEVDKLGRLPARDEVPGRILFTGTMSYPPNAQAARWFATEVLNRIRERQPDATFTVVGRDPSAEVRSLGSLPGVDVTGRVPDLRPWLAEAQVVVAPLLSGGGTKLKVVEAMAAGRPVAATSIGAEGIDGQHGEHLLVADGAEAFATAVADLLSDRARAERIAERGKALAAARYSWDAASVAMRDAVERWLAGAEQ